MQTENRYFKGTWCTSRNIAIHDQVINVICVMFQLFSIILLYSMSLPSGRLARTSNGKSQALNEKNDRFVQNSGGKSVKRKKIARLNFSPRLPSTTKDKESLETIVLESRRQYSNIILSEIWLLIMLTLLQHLSIWDSYCLRQEEASKNLSGMCQN